MSFSYSTPRKDTSGSRSLMSMNELDETSGLGKSWRDSLREKEERDWEFEAHCASCQNEIDSTRQDIEVLMMKTYAYARSSGLEADRVVNLPKTSPRHNFM